MINSATAAVVEKQEENKDKIERRANVEVTQDREN